MGDLDRAAFEYRQALRLRPEHAEAQRALQALEAARGRPGA
jgi:hypothetical protein